ncbi:MAG: glycosyltransferase [Planctomycetota bacterium]
MTESDPLVSIVMGVHNGECDLAKTMDSILSQTFDNFEFIVVDDGSTDRSAELLTAFAQRDRRVVVVSQENQGLTRALITGSEHASGHILARQDVGDVSNPERLARQVEYLHAHPEVVAVSTGYRRVGPKGEYLGSQVREMTPAEVTSVLLNEGAGIPHTAAMIRMDAFQKAGGYRAAFRFAQDSDLWYRLSEHGLLAELNESLFDWGIDTGGISASNRHRQQSLADLARQCYDARRAGDGESELLKRAEVVSWESTPAGGDAAFIDPSAAAEFFIGSQLYALKDSRCRAYLRRAIRRHPVWPAAWAKLALSYLRSPRVPALDQSGRALES